MYLCNVKEKNMGQLAFLRMFILVAISIDANDNRRHVHVFYKGKRHQHYPEVSDLNIETNLINLVTNLKT